MNVLSKKINIMSRKNHLHRNGSKYISFLFPGGGMNVLVYTSLIFITNILTALYKEYYLYAFLFFMLTITSVIVHTHDNIYTNTLDKCSVMLVVIYGGNMLWNKYLLCGSLPVFIVFAAFIFCIYVYLYGYLQRNYCFHSQKCVADVYHSLLHLISSLGHHLIILL